ncbi:MAG: ABC transporter ATP-binding protein [Clostridia bacterium]|nr:ABC transporter ATP-binding protein [Clostridia bacterium]
MIVLDQVSKTYAKGAIKAVDGLSLHVKRGELFGFIGPNGAGKTTTIKMLTGILAPDSGRVQINGHDMAQDPLSCKRSFCFVPDTPNVYDRLTGREYLDFVSDMYELDDKTRQQAVEKYVAMFGLEDVLQDQIRSYSHGMRQKLSLTGALLPNPPLWIMDEPLVGLDPRSQHLLKQEMRAHCERGNTIFFSTHVLDMAERLCDRIAIIDRGRIVAAGTLEELQSGRDETLENLFLALTDREALA